MSFAFPPGFRGRGDWRGGDGEHRGRGRGRGRGIYFDGFSETSFSNR